MAGENKLSEQPPSEYRFTDEERALQQQRRSEILLLKERIHDLNVSLEGAQAELREKQALYQGANEITMTRMGMANADIPPDQSRLVRKA